MSNRFIKPRLTALSAACSCAGFWVCISPVLAADADTTAVNLDKVIVTSQKTIASSHLPSTTESVSALQIEESVNSVTAAGVLQYLPSTHVRERYVGDRNGVLVMRLNSSIASAQTVVYADGMLLSNLLNNSFSTAPRWGMVSPEEIARVDILYGPFSALYPGNSAGGVVNINTRMPDKLELHAKLDAFGQHFKLYGTDGDFGGGHASASVGNAFGDWSFFAAIDHLDNQGQPQTFGNAAPKSGAPASAGSFTDVSRSTVYRDIDTAGQPRIIVSSTGIDHTVQDLAKLRVAYRVTPSLQASYSLGIWRNQSTGSVDSYLRDANGNTVYNAGASLANPFKYVRIDGSDYTVSAAAPSRSSSEHWMQGFALKTSTGGPWDFELVASVYDQKKDVSRSATPTSGLDSGEGALRPGGQITYADGTGWQNIDLRGVWRSSGALASQHQLSFGLHHDRYQLASSTYGTTASPIADWLTSDTGVLNTNSFGKTQTDALYLQDEWRVAPDWTLVLGGRQESWRAFDGSNYNASNTGLTPKNLVYGERSQSDFSPKLHLAYQASPSLAFKASLGKGVRYPTVAEMFQTFNGPDGIKTNDPNLKPEQVLASEWVAQQSFKNGMVRASLFFEDKRDALISQTDVTVTPNLSSIQNVDKVRTNGVEIAWQTSDVLMGGFDLNGSVTYAHSIIERDARNPGLEGTLQPRIPDWRATLVGTWHVSSALTASLSYRFSGRQHNSLFDTKTQQYKDPNRDVYGAVSHYSVFDAKLLYRLSTQWSASLGVNNLGNFKYYVNPNPYPQRTWFAGLKFDL